MRTFLSVTLPYVRGRGVIRSKWANTRKLPSTVPGIKSALNEYEAWRVAGPASPPWRSPDPPNRLPVRPGPARPGGRCFAVVPSRVLRTRRPRGPQRCPACGRGARAAPPNTPRASLRYVARPHGSAPWRNPGRGRHLRLAGALSPRRGKLAGCVSVCVWGLLCHSYPRCALTRPAWPSSPASADGSPALFLGCSLT